MILKRTLSIFLAVLMIGMTFTAFPITVNAATVDTAGTAVNKTFTIKTADDLSVAISEINAVTQPTTYAIDLQTDLENCEIGIKNGNAEVTVIGNGKTISATQSAVYVSDGAKVILGDGKSALTLTSADNNDTAGIVDIQYDSFCNMYDKVTLKDHKGDANFGGGVTVKGGTFHMYGGTIENCGIGSGSICFGGGVAVFAGGKFIMDNGIITRCYARSDYIYSDDPDRGLTAMGGGVFVSAGSTFTMNGGTISECEATNMGGGIAMAISDSTFGDDEMDEKGMGNPSSCVTINSGTISGNKARLGAGVAASGYYYAFSSAIHMFPAGVGLPDNPGLFINGGIIKQNKAEEMGGGILVAMIKPAAKILLHNATISENKADTGAGIESFGYWTQMDVDGCTVTDNTAVSNGGGIMAAANSSGGYTTIKNATINNNSSGDRGAGVCYDANSEIRISGADIIQDNEFNGKMNNLNVYSLDKPVKVIGDLTGSQIGLSDPTLWDDGMEDYDAEAVSTKRLTDGFKANNASLIPATAFTSDHESWYVDFGEKKTEQGAEIGRTYKYKADKYNNATQFEDGGRIVKQGTTQFICLKAETFNTGKAENAYSVYTDMLARYNRKYESKGENYYGDPFFYDSLSDKYAALYYAGNVMYVYIGNYNAAYYENYGSCDCWLYAGASHQQYANSGEIVYQYGPISPNTSLFVTPTYESTPSQTNVDLTYSTPLNFNGNDTIEVYERNDLGIITSKYVINKSSEVVDIQYDTVTTDYTDEVRLVHRTKIDYHINNADIIDAKYDDGKPETDDDIFTSYVEKATGKDVKVGETIDEFYTVPEVVPTATNSCPYIFKGWYYDRENDNDSHPVKFGTDKYAKDIYAHWIKVDNVKKDADDPTMFQDGGDDTYGGFDLAGVQIRKKMLDHNFEEVTPGGMRFITSLSMDVVNEINKIKPNNIEYGYVAATHKGWIDYHCDGVKHGSDEKLKYVSETANGIDTSSAKATNENYFGFAKNVNCTSKVTNSKNGVVRRDHQNFDKYLLYSLVITYEDAGSDKGKDVLARPYIRYKDANGLERVAYSEYTGTNVLGGCYTNYNRVADMAGN